MKKQTKIKSLLIAIALILGFSSFPAGASADTAYNTTLNPGEQKQLAREYIIGGGSVVGNQQNVFSGGNRGVQYVIQDGSGNNIKVENHYNVTVNITFDAGLLGKFISLIARNLNRGSSDAVKVTGTLKD
ncbi:hypothetical protein [Sutcliffiella rhizosphaerae]|uniref:Uncharacterized protein n=1 Tax=Sutcliffiella rhizosphaerae TaxID=2880967 RepID=A0ABN8AC56_9BACI|nr:hypothetical protein [Sutcliffiella rhizosphaerae]CAG9622775.1 hypothetical protein BACCIP111883_03566 [Sutcliffiella rhizosphaerae]